MISVIINHSRILLIHIYYLVLKLKYSKEKIKCIFKDAIIKES